MSLSRRSARLIAVAAVLATGVLAPSAPAGAQIAPVPASSIAIVVLPANGDAVRRLHVARLAAASRRNRVLRYQRHNRLLRRDLRRLVAARAN